MNKLLTAAIVSGAAIAVGVLPAASLAEAATAPTPIPVPGNPSAPTTPGGVASGSATDNPHAPSHRTPGHRKKASGHQTGHRGRTGGSGHNGRSGGTGGSGKPVTHRPPAHQPVTRQPVVHKPVARKPVAHQPVHKPVRTPVVHPPVIAPPVIDAPVMGQPVAKQPAGHRHRPIRRPVVHKPAPMASLAAMPTIVGGQNATAPWAVQVSWDDTGFECTGTAIAPQWVLTAGHCASTSGMTVLIGSPQLGQGTKAVVDNKVVDPDGDLALLHLTDPVRTKYIPLADEDPEVGSLNEIYGWGKTAEDSGPSDLLKSAKVKVTATDCEDSVGGRAICSTGITGNAFNGDSGGPEIADGAEVGVCSTGNAQAKTQEYASVAANRDWIRQVANV